MHVPDLGPFNQGDGLVMMREQGAKAFRDGRPISVCPYTVAYRAQAWRDGWENAAITKEAAASEIHDFELPDDDEETVHHPSHYGGDTVYEAIKVIEAWGLNFNTGNAAKYIARAGKKSDYLEDLKKARWYLDREIAANAG